MDYPPNSKLPRSSAPPEKKKIERVTSAEAGRRKKTLGRQFRETFIGGDAKSAVHYVFFGVMIPAAKEMLAEAGREGIERLIFGESRGMRGRRPPSSPTGYISYNQLSRGAGPLPAGRNISPQARARFDFDDIVLDTRSEAETVLDSMFDILSRYEAVSVADLYELTGIKPTHTDHKWGWVDLRGSTISRLRGQGYLLDLPDPESL